MFFRLNNANNVPFANKFAQTDDTFTNTRQWESIDTAVTQHG